MNLFLSQEQNYYTGNMSQFKNELIVDKMVDFFKPNLSDKYFFMDPYLNVINSIQEPFRESTVEEKIWSFLIYSLSYTNVEFSIITREDIEGLVRNKDELPYMIPCEDLSEDGVSIQVCQYRDGRHCDLALHDRYIIQEKNGKYKGLHIGPSLEDIIDKDISITAYSEESAIRAFVSFNSIWNACIKNKGWKKG
jgi:hypothetical protein